MISFPTSLPTTKSLASIRLIQRTQGAFYRSPFNGVTQVQANQGEWWEAQIQFPPMKRYQAEDYLAVLMGLRGPQGAVYLGDSNAKTPRGSIAGSPIVYPSLGSVNSLGAKVLFTYGWTPNASNVLRAGDYIQLDAGYQATRIQSSGGGDITKYFYDVGASVNTQNYIAAVRIKNIGNKTVRVSANIGSSQDVTAGSETHVIIFATGDGIGNVQLKFQSLVASDSLDFIVWDPKLSVWGSANNQIPIANRKFSGWNRFGSPLPTITLTQGINQRLYKVMKDVTAKSDGSAEVDIFPSLRAVPIADQPLVTSNAKGVFRLASPQFDFNIDSDLAYGFSAQLVEAL